LSLVGRVGWAIVGIGVLSLNFVLDFVSCSGASRSANAGSDSRANWAADCAANHATCDSATGASGYFSSGVHIPAAVVCPVISSSSTCAVIDHIIIRSTIGSVACGLAAGSTYCCAYCRTCSDSNWAADGPDRATDYCARACSGSTAYGVPGFAFIGSSSHAGTCSTAYCGTNTRANRPSDQTAYNATRDSATGAADRLADHAAVIIRAVTVIGIIVKRTRIALNVARTVLVKDIPGHILLPAWNACRYKDAAAGYPGLVYASFLFRYARVHKSTY
jgi:hypothetical protein